MSGDVKLEYVPRCLESGVEANFGLLRAMATLANAAGSRTPSTATTEHDMDHMVSSLFGPGESKTKDQSLPFVVPSPTDLPISPVDHSEPQCANESGKHSHASRQGQPSHSQLEQYRWTLVDDDAPNAGGSLVKFVVFYPGALKMLCKLHVLGAPDAKGWDVTSGAALKKIAAGVYRSRVARLPARCVLRYRLMLSCCALRVD